MRTLLASLLLASSGWADNPARDCGRCHTSHYDDWRGSAHARATTSPLFEWQELLYRASLQKDGAKNPQLGDNFCRDCHGSTDEGVGCLTCHRMAAVAEGTDPHPSKRITWGEPNVMLGPIADPKDALVHGSKKSDIHTNEKVCLACHDHDIQAGGTPCCTVVREWRADEIHESMRCQSCHMRAVKNVPVARGGPQRKQAHRHNFPAAGDLDQARGGWDLGLAVGKSVDVTVSNLAGHTLPNGEPYGTRVVLRVEARDARGQVLAVAEQSFGFEMLNGAGVPTMFPHEAVRRGGSNVLAIGEERKLSFDLPKAAQYVATLGYAMFDPPEEAWLRVRELEAWIREKRPDWLPQLTRLRGRVAALARPVEIRRVGWPK